MRVPGSFFALLAAAVLALGAEIAAHAQSTDQQVPANATYENINPLAGVSYDNRFDLSLGMAYDHMKAGPNLLQGSNLGGLDLSGSYWLTKHWGLEGSGRAYLGTSGAAVNHYGISGPFVAEYFFTGGPEFLGPHNEHGDIIFHALMGGVYGDFNKDLVGRTPPGVNYYQVADFYNNQVAPAAILGGHLDLNRSAHWVFRVTPDAVFTWYGTNYPPNITQTDVNFAISVGMEYKFRRKR
jgi:hypothetical protein